MAKTNTFNWIVHRLFRRPYRVYCRTDSGKGQPVVLLHGIASNGSVWRHVVARLQEQHVRTIVVDLLGFGKSPKPTDDWVRYDVTDHAKAVIATLQRRKVRRRAVLVGHSMGCFVAIEVALLRPDLVKQLILYEPPFYEGLPATNKYRLRQASYFALYRTLIKRPPLGIRKFVRAQKLIAEITGFDLSEATWIPFQRSMRNTILQQRALNDLKQIKTPTQIVYGRYDQFVFNDKNNLFFKDTAPHVVVTELPALHAISKRASEAIAESIVATAEHPSSKPKIVTKLRPKARRTTS
jgi:pimeloyl-ACP methyl ester carboxylesterase